MNTVLTDACPVCNGQSLKCCEQCRVVCYCSDKHQDTHREQHKQTCLVIQAHQRHFAIYEYQLRDPICYLIKRERCVRVLRKVETLAAVQAAVDYARNMVRFDRRDNLGARAPGHVGKDVSNLLPALYLRTGQDQECYDFVKWWCQNHGDRDWYSHDFPFLDIKDADVFEDVGAFVGKFATQLCQVVAITLLKIRLYLDLESLQGLSAITMPPELLDNIRDKFLGNMMAHNPRRKSIVEGEDLVELMTLLKGQIKRLHRRVEAENPLIWPHLLNPGLPVITKRGESVFCDWPFGPVEVMERLVEYSYASWKETPRALKLLEKLENGRPMIRKVEWKYPDEELETYNMSTRFEDMNITSIFKGWIRYFFQNNEL